MLFTLNSIIWFNFNSLTINHYKCDRFETHNQFSSIYSPIQCNIALFYGVKVGHSAKLKYIIKFVAYR